jgi:methionyl aminopeptidase
MFSSQQFQLFSEEQINALRIGGEILGSCLSHMATLVKPGVQTVELDREAQAYIQDRGAKPAFKGYKGFPFTLCTSINEECVHGMPSERALNDGDIISIDCGVLYKSLYTDSCITVAVGEISTDAKKLMSVTSDALDRALSILRAGTYVGDISSIIEKTVRAEGFAPVKALTGHGLGDTLHQFPDIPNFGTAGTGPKIPAGTILAIEPIISAGGDDIKEEEDNWTIRTSDRSLCAHVEHTVYVTEKGSEILSKA